ncbi:MAG: linear amide C-N hydrolase [Gammaproteobacteria bacterium]|nr:linear amide C-N hydrolase [Gammaproteobacteria bacterium]
MKNNIQLPFTKKLYPQIGCNAAVISKHNKLYVGRNLDVTFENGFWVINQRNVNKTAYIPFDDKDIPMSWVSRYGSVTMNALHLDIPLGGMNEKGLLVEHLALENSKFPEKDDRKAITPFQWIQYQVDNYSTVDEVVETESLLRINPWIFGFVHFLVCDAHGNMAIIEYQKDKYGKSQRLVYNNKDFPEYFWALGNAPYLEHIDFMKQFKDFGGTISVPTDRKIISPNIETTANDTKYQFATSAKMLKHFSSKNHDPESCLFDIMEKVSRNKFTQVTVVYHPSDRLLKFKTAKNSAKRVIDFKYIDFSSNTQRSALFWHDEVKENNWNTDLSYVNSFMLDHFAEYFWLDTFKAYKDDLKHYPSECPYANE